jgi:hypothetical protein
MCPKREGGTLHGRRDASFEQDRGLAEIATSGDARHAVGPRTAGDRGRLTWSNRRDSPTQPRQPDHSPDESTEVESVLPTATPAFLLGYTLNHFGPTPVSAATHPAAARSIFPVSTAREDVATTSAGRLCLPDRLWPERLNGEPTATSEVGGGY